MQTEMIFNRKDEALKVRRRLSDFGYLSFLRGRELVIEVPNTKTPAQAWDLARRIHRGEA